MTYYEAIKTSRELAVKGKIWYVVFEYVRKHWWNRTRYGYMGRNHYLYDSPYEPHVIRLTITPTGAINQ